ncbi:hypothetical protein IMY05_C4432000200 [Salix suchowensis]|nr:hypothetical protein IMY05_C4432000200 [Salix suchowensis]
MAAFLNTHGESIEELQLSFCRPIGGPPFSIATLQLLSLYRLSVAWNLFNRGDENPFQQLWTNAFFPPDCLKITSPFMDVDHLAIFATCSNVLVELVCGVLNFLLGGLPEPTHSRTPKQSLRISNTQESFAIEMGRREYTNWILYDLEITPPKSLSFGQPEYFPPASYHAMQIGRAIYPAFAAFVGASYGRARGCEILLTYMSTPRCTLTSDEE